MKIKIKERHIITFRSALVTAFILLSAIVAVMLMGKAYSGIRKTAFGETTQFFDMKNSDVYTFFGYEFEFPLIYYTEKIVAFCKLYAPGIIKLLGNIVDVIKESWSILVKLF